MPAKKKILDLYYFILTICRTACSHRSQHEQKNPPALAERGIVMLSPGGDLRSHE